MIYVYDMVMNKERITSFKRYGIKYHLERKFLMGNREFYSFIAPGAEKILVVPGFAEMYRDVEAMLNRYNGDSTYNAYIKWVKKNVNQRITEEDIPSSESTNGVIKTVVCDYKDIRVTFEYLNGKMRISQEFEIRDHNIFGNGIVVLMNIDMNE